VQLKVEAKPKQAKSEPLQKVIETWAPTYSKQVEYGCVPLELISDLGIEKHWKVKLKSLTEIENILDQPGVFSNLHPHIPGFINFLIRISWDTNNNVVAASLKLLSWVISQDSSVVAAFNIEDIIPMLI